MAAARTRAVAVRGAGTGRRVLRRVLPGLADLAGYRRAWLRSDVLAGLSLVTGLHVGPESSIAIVTAATIGGLAAGAPERGAALASVLALVAAGCLVPGAVLRLAVVARLLSTPVLAGYLTGSAIVIGTGQLGKILAIPTPGERWWQKLGEAAIARTRTALRDTLRRLDLEERIGPENFHLRVRDAVAAFSDRASG
jgi:sulfate permease, SulP family